MNDFLRNRSVRIGAVIWAISMVGNTETSANPYASSVVSYVPGSTPVAGYTTPAVALGQPERVTGEGFGFPGVVSMFNPPFGTDEIVSIGEGGQITLKFDTPILNSSANLFGADFILFTNAGFIDTSFPSGQIGSPPGQFGNDDALVEVSADGSTWFTVSTNLADGAFPTQGFLDSGPFDVATGSVPTNFQKPVDPSLTVADFAGLTYAGALALYDGSGGGTPVDIASTGLSSASFVRISVLDDGNALTSLNFELDAISGVPEPMTLGLLSLGLLGRRRHRGRE
jgi:hypothetical protein